MPAVSRLVVSIVPNYSRILMEYPSEPPEIRSSLWRGEGGGEGLHFHVG